VIDPTTAKALRPASGEEHAEAAPGGTVSERKPHPAPLLHAAQSLGVAPAQCIYIGDAERDVLAARAAGMDVFVALFGYIPADEHPKDWPASGWLDSPQALARLLGSICNPR
jgi:N-acetyl-D-muramate 6-phosphate phosphatase